MARARAADLLVLVGGRLGEIPPQGYSLLSSPSPQTRLVHIHPGAEEIGRVYYRPHLTIHASPTRFVAALKRLNVTANPAWRENAAAAHEDFLAWTSNKTAQPGNVNFGELMIWLRDHVPTKTILCNGAGNYASWIHRFYRFREYMTHVAPTSASMGYARGDRDATDASRQACPVSQWRLLDERPGVLRLPFSIAYRLPIIVVVCDNGMDGTIRMHQEREFPGRVCATELLKPDFDPYARAFVGFGVVVNETSEFPAAFKPARELGLPSIIHLKIDPDAILPAATLSGIRERALQQEEFLRTTDQP